MRLKENQIRVGLFAVALLAMVPGFRLLLFTHAPSIFTDALEDMSYGWYVPVFSLYVLWTERRRILESVGAPSWSGTILSNEGCRKASLMARPKCRSVLSESINRKISLLPPDWMSFSVKSIVSVSARLYLHHSPGCRARVRMEV